MPKLTVHQGVQNMQNDPIFVIVEKLSNYLRTPFPIPDSAVAPIPDAAPPPIPAIKPYFHAFSKYMQPFIGIMNGSGTF